MNDLATYAGIGSAALLALPAIRAASLQGDKAAIEAELSTDQAVREGQERALTYLTRRIALGAGADRRAIRRGLALLTLSAILFLAAIALPMSAPVLRLPP